MLLPPVRSVLICGTHASWHDRNERTRPLRALREPAAARRRLRVRAMPSDGVRGLQQPVRLLRRGRLRLLRRLLRRVPDVVVPRGTDGTVRTGRTVRHACSTSRGTGASSIATVIAIRSMISSPSCASCATRAATCPWCPPPAGTPPRPTASGSPMRSTKTPTDSLSSWARAGAARPSCFPPEPDPSCNSQPRTARARTRSAASRGASSSAPTST